MDFPVALRSFFFAISLVWTLERLLITNPLHCEVLFRFGEANAIDKLPVSEL